MGLLAGSAGAPSPETIDPSVSREAERDSSAFLLPTTVWSETGISLR